MPALQWLVNRAGVVYRQLLQLFVRRLEVRGDHPSVGIYGRMTVHTIRLHEAQKWPIAGGLVAVGVLVFGVTRYPEVLEVPPVVEAISVSAKPLVATTAKRVFAADVAQCLSFSYLRLAARAESARRMEEAQRYRCRARSMLRGALRLPVTEAVKRTNLRILLRIAELTDSCHRSDGGYPATTSVL